jgi:hypothetical protein
MCNKLVDCYTCHKIETCHQVDAAFGPDTRRNAKKSPKLCVNADCRKPRAKGSRFCLECRRIDSRAKYQAQRLRRLAEHQPGNYVNPATR